jgi:hypothetical protein
MGLDMKIKIVLLFSLIVYYLYIIIIINWSFNYSTIINYFINFIIIDSRCDRSMDDRAVVDDYFFAKKKIHPVSFSED